MVLRHDISQQQESLQHKGLSGCQNKAAILYKGDSANDKRLSPGLETAKRR